MTTDDVVFLDAADPPAVDRYLLTAGLAAADELPCGVARAGDGNMNVTLRVTLRGRTLILKQGRPWVAKYDHVAAPFDRTLVEGAFYAAVQETPAVASRMPALIRVDPHHRVLALEDVGTGGDCTSIYRDPRMDDAAVDALLAWLAGLAQVRPSLTHAATLANRDMRALNHEHMFRLPLADGNGLDLDAITPGLAAAAHALKQDDGYRGRVSTLAGRYLEDGDAVVHGDYFPGSWVRGTGGIRIIDPEFAFLGVREFDYGVMIGHFALSGTAAATAARVLAAGRGEGLDGALILGYAGTEIMRRLIGVAQLPLPHGLARKTRLLDCSRSLVLAPESGLACWP